MKVRIAVVVDKNGMWSASAFGEKGVQTSDKEMLDAAYCGMDGCDELVSHYFIEAEIEVPIEKTIIGKKGRT